MNLTPLELIKRYQRLLSLYDFISLISVYIIILASTWFLWIPDYNEQLNVTGSVLVVIIFVMYILGYFIAKRLMIKPESNFRYFIYLIVILGVFLQDVVGAETLFSIILITMAAIVNSTVGPIQSQIERTQNFTSTERTSSELLEIILQSYKYLISKRDWLLNIILLQISISVAILLGLTLNDVLTIYIDLEIVQFLTLGILFILVALFATTLFPKINKPDKYQQMLDPEWHNA